MSKLSEALGRPVPFADHLGVEVVERVEGRVRLRLRPRAEQCNIGGSLHGGVLMTLLDMAMAVACSNSQAGKPSGMTVDMSAQFLRSTVATEVLSEGIIVKAGSKLVFCEATVTEPDGKIVAKASGTYVPRVDK